MSEHHNICPRCNNPNEGPRCRDHFYQTAVNAGKKKRKKQKLVPDE